MLKQNSSEYRGFRTAGIRLREEMMPHLARLTAGRARAMFHALHAFDKAQAVMLTEQGLLPRETAAAILRALREMEKEGVEETRSKVGGGLHSGEQYLIRCGSGFWGRPASESGTLRHGDGAHGRSDRCRRSFVLPCMKPAGRVKWPLGSSLRI